MQPLSHRAELVKLELHLDTSRSTIRGLLRIKNKTKHVILKILWECKYQRNTMKIFEKKEAAYVLNSDQRYTLYERLKETENIYHEYSKL